MLKKILPSSPRSATAPALLEVPYVRVGQGGGPDLKVFIKAWIPAFAGMTPKIINRYIATRL